MLFLFALSKDEVVSVLFVLLLSCVLFAIISTWFYFCLCIVGSNIWVDEDAKTNNLEHFERTISTSLTSPRTLTSV